MAVGLARPSTGSGGASPGVVAPGPGAGGVTSLAGDQLAAATVLGGRPGGGVRLQEPGRGVGSQQVQTRIELQVHVHVHVHVQVDYTYVPVVLVPG